MRSNNSSRIKKFQAHLKKLGCDTCIIEDPVDLFYLTGLHFSCGTLMVSPKEAHLYVDGRYIQVAREKSPTKVSLIGELAPGKIKKLGFDSDTVTYARYLSLKKKFPKAKLISLSSPVRPLRLIKDKEEIILMKKSADLLWKGYQHMQKEIREGISEKELALIFEVFCLQNGAEAMAFDPIVAFGPNSAMPHYRAGDTRLKKGDVVLIDIGVVLNNYHSDMTRMQFFGPAHPKLEKMYNVVRESQRAALKKCKPGVKLKELDLAARAVMKKKGMEDLFIHGLGHGIGLLTHEGLRIKFDNIDKDMKLEAGMVITVEPGLYVPNLGGIRHEDTVCITPRGYENFFSE